MTAYIQKNNVELNTNIKPQNVEDVDSAVMQMDKIYKTSFYGFLKNPDHLDQIAVHCKRVIKDYDVEVIGVGLSWLTESWPTSKTAELLIKMFYNWGMGHPKFAQVVNEITKAYSRDKVVDLILILMIGEDSEIAAKFVSYLTLNWTADSVIQLVKQLSKQMKWEVKFFKLFILHYTCLAYENSNQEYGKATVELVGKLFSVYNLLLETSAPADPMMQTFLQTLKISQLPKALSPSQKLLRDQLVCNAIFEMICNEFKEINGITNGKMDSAIEGMTKLNVGSRRSSPVKTRSPQNAFSSF